MAAKKTLAPPPVLNDRQRHYLLAAYQLDQQLEAAHKKDYLRGVVTPAAEWRAMPYGRWQHFLEKPPTKDVVKQIGQKLRVRGQMAWLLVIRCKIGLRASKNRLSYTLLNAIERGY